MPPAPRPRRPGAPTGTSAVDPADSAALGVADSTGSATDSDMALAAFQAPQLGTESDASAAARGGGRPGGGPGGPPAGGPGGTPVTAPTESERPIDGTGTNADHPTWGAANTAQIRLTPADYPDATGATPAGGDRPSPRAISNAVVEQTTDMPNARGLSDMFWAWGQFIDHDLDLTAGGSEAMPIAIPRGDPDFDPTGSGVRTMSFSRSAVAEGTGVTDARAPINLITSVMDASMVYGSSPEVAASIRTDDGKLLLGADGLLVPDGSGFGLMTGDVRAAENVGLTSLHVVFAREHNRIVDALAERFPDLSGDELYAAARARVEGLVQAITYREFLPQLLGGGGLGPYRGHDPDVDPSVSVEFSTVAFRFGHSLLSPEIERLEADGSTSAAGNLALRDAFFNPGAIAEGGGVDPILRGLAGSTAQALDSQIVEDVRSFLFGAPGSGGLDLASLNIQRGRDHGVASYNDLREALGLPRRDSFLSITGGDQAEADRLEAAYGDVDLVDAWIGGLAEAPVRGGQVGELFRAILVDQFTRIREGDPFWSEATLSPQERRMIWNTTLSEVIERNTDSGALQHNAFIAHERLGGSDGADSLTGTDGRDLILGGGGGDVLIGGRGHDELRGDDGADRFVFSRGTGHDAIRDFGAGDVLDLTAFTQLDSLADLRLDPREPGLVVQLGQGDTILLCGVRSLDEGSVVFA